MLSADDERQQRGLQSMQRRHRPAVDRGTTSTNVDREDPNTSQPEGLFTELESALDAASAHLLSTEAVVDANSTYDASIVDHMVSYHSLHCM